MQGISDAGIFVGSWKKLDVEKECLVVFFIQV